MCGGCRNFKIIPFEIIYLSNLKSGIFCGIGNLKISRSLFACRISSELFTSIIEIPIDSIVYEILSI